MFWRERIAMFVAFIMLASLALGSYWLAKRARISFASEDKPVRHEPDYFVEGFTVQRMNGAGQIAYTMRAARMEHFPDDDSSLLKQPVLTSFSNPATPVQATAESGHVTQDGNVVVLKKSVRVDRAPTATEPALTIRTEQLTAHPDDDIAFTELPVVVTQGSSTLKGVGLHLNNLHRQVQVKRDVRATWEAPDNHR